MKDESARPCVILACGRVPTRRHLNGALCVELHAPSTPAPPAGTTLDERLRALGRSSISGQAPTRLRSLAERVGEPGVIPGRRVTSHAAARKALPRSGTQRRLVLEAIFDAWKRGHGGATDHELTRRLALSGNSVRPRRVELVESWLIEDSGRTRTAHGTQHTVWQPTRDALAALGYRPDEKVAERRPSGLTLDVPPDPGVEYPREWWSE